MKMVIRSPHPVVLLVAGVQKVTKRSLSAGSWSNSTTGCGVLRTENTRKHEKTRENSIIDDPIPAPCSAFLLSCDESEINLTFSEKALQGAGIEDEKTRENRKSTRKPVQESAHLEHV